MAILRKIKSGVKKIIARGKSAAAAKRPAPAARKNALKKPPVKPSRRAVVKQAVLSQEKEILGVSETAVGKMKFSTPEAVRSSLRSMPTELPASYGKTDWSSTPGTRIGYIPTGRSFPARMTLCAAVSGTISTKRKRS